MSDVLAAVRAALDFSLPATISTVSSDGTPNVSYLSRLLFVDDEHIALTNQFFRKTKANLQANPRACILVVDPDGGRQHLLSAVYERSETEGPLFERLRAELDAVASLFGMADVFRLCSADVFRVEACERLQVEADASKDDASST